MGEALKGSEMKLPLSEFFNDFCFPLRVHELAVSSVPVRRISSCQMAGHEPHGLAFCVFLSNKMENLNQTQKKSFLLKSCLNCEAGHPGSGSQHFQTFKHRKRGQNCHQQSARQWCNMTLCEGISTLAAHWGHLGAANRRASLTNLGA